ncbi:spore germination protein GerPE [Bacillus sp. 2205SS5-2]|uniref:spore germination protein GerPE n=1 Tax=Bacillus sp. 2205SS5-2 TaxID=3109031 RepID=UPI0030044D3B
MSRYSFVQGVNLTSLIFSSVLQIGDTRYLDGKSKVLAVQREQEIFFGNEGDDLYQYPVFYEQIPFLTLPPPTNISILNQKPVINVGIIDIIGVSTTGIVHIGNLGDVRLESRIKHIRQLENQNGE